MNATVAASCLDRGRLYPHSNTTSGQSRWGGVGTSHRAHRSRLLGRVVAAHVQGSPKGGDALCVRRVPNTRLGPVPPLHKEARLDRGHAFSFNQSMPNWPTFPLMEGGRA